MGNRAGFGQLVVERLSISERVGSEYLNPSGLSWKGPESHAVSQTRRVLCVLEQYWLSIYF
jgi:hypothetical protein